VQVVLRLAPRQNLLAGALLFDDRSQRVLEATVVDFN